MLPTRNISKLVALANCFFKDLHVLKFVVFLFFQTCIDFSLPSSYEMFEPQQ